MKKVLFIKNAVILTVTSLALRVIGIVFRVWLAGKIGAEGIGLYQVIFSVYILMTAFATSGICTAVTRMVAARLAVNDGVGAKRTMKMAILLSLIIAIISSLTVFAFSNAISFYLVKDVRASQSLRILCISLPFLGVCSCIRGYFFARRNTLPSSFGQITEQIVRISVIVFLLGKFSSQDLKISCAVVMAGDVISEIAGTVIISIFYRFDVKHLKGSTAKKSGIMRELVRISLPITAGKYAHTGLRTAENLLTPICFSKYTSSRSTALEQFGMIKGMALPLLLFPASLLSAVSTLLIPEMTEDMERKNYVGIAATVEKIFYLTFITSFWAGSIFLCSANQLGNAIYSSSSVGYLIRALSPLVPFMYVDLIGDGILKGLDQQNILLRNSVIDSAVRIILVMLLVPKFGMTGFFAVMMFSNLFTGCLSVHRITKISKVKFNFSVYFFKPLFSAVLSAAIADKICASLRNSNIMYICCTGAIITVVYLVILTLTGGMKPKIILGKIRQKMSKK